MMRIRPFQPGDEAALHAVFHSAIHGTASRDYTAEQVEAWSPSHLAEEMRERWKARMAGIQPHVVEADTRIAAYGDLQVNGYIDHFFVAAEFGGRGIGTLLMRYILQVAQEKNIGLLTSDVSLTAQPFFLRFGFEIVERRVVEVRGVKLDNARMQRVLEKR
jgi:putative acetyltransferase